MNLTEFELYIIYELLCWFQWFILMQELHSFRTSSTCSFVLFPPVSGSFSKCRAKLNCMLEIFQGMVKLFFCRTLFIEQYVICSNETENAKSLTFNAVCVEAWRIFFVVVDHLHKPILFFKSSNFVSSTLICQSCVVYRFVCWKKNMQASIDLLSKLINSVVTPFLCIWITNVSVNCIRSKEITLAILSWTFFNSSYSNKFRKLSVRPEFRTIELWTHPSAEITFNEIV